jgi:UDP-2,3-diacylglucosamine pyrophosphatase LpxH
MLIVISDLHLSDGTCAKSVSPSAFYLFADRLREIAYHASWRKDNTYRPIENIDLVLLGDILDPIQSTRWLEKAPGDPHYIRPWSAVDNPLYAAKLEEVTSATMLENAESLEVLRSFSRGELIKLLPATRVGVPAKKSRERIIPNVRIHYMIGNHDWYYHLPGPAFDAIRAGMVAGMGLSNPPGVFPFTLEESAPLHAIFDGYKAYARHGDCFDRFNYDAAAGRDAATLGDVFAMEVLNRYPLEAVRRLGADLPKGIADSLRQLVNVRPTLATSLWISGQIKQHAGSPALEEKLKKIWDDVCDEFLQNDFVRSRDKFLFPDMVDVLQTAVKIQKIVDFQTINEFVIWLREKISSDGKSFVEHALQEEAFKNNSARYIVYGHTHHHEIVSLDAEGQAPYPDSQVYFNSGTWHSYYDLAVKNPREQKFVPYQALTYVNFYKDDERGGRHFETWSGSFA